MLNGRPGTVTLERFFFACVLTQKVKKVYHLVGRPLKCPVWDQVPELRVLMWFFAMFVMGLHEAALDGILLRYWRRNQSGSRDMESAR